MRLFLLLSLYPLSILRRIHKQIGHDNWVRALVFHPNGKFLLSASDDKTVRIWDLATGRCSKTIEAHGHFVTCMSWGRAVVSGGTGGEGGEASRERQVNVLATGSVDQSVKVSLRACFAALYTHADVQDYRAVHRSGRRDEERASKSLELVVVVDSPQENRARCPSFTSSPDHYLVLLIWPKANHELSRSDGFVLKRAARLNDMSPFPSPFALPRYCFPSVAEHPPFLYYAHSHTLLRFFFLLCSPHLLAFDFLGLPSSYVAD